MPKRPVQLPTPASLEEGWKNIEAVMRQTMPDKPIPSFARDMYYAGAATLFSIVTESPEMDAPIGDDQAGLDLMDRIMDELKGYARDMEPAISVPMPKGVM